MLNNPIDENFTLALKAGDIHSTCITVETMQDAYGSTTVVELINSTEPLGLSNYIENIHKNIRKIAGLEAQISSTLYVTGENKLFHHQTQVSTPSPLKTQDIENISTQVPRFWEPIRFTISSKA